MNLLIETGSVSHPATKVGTDSVSLMAVVLLVSFCCYGCKPEPPSEMVTKGAEDVQLVVSIPEPVATDYVGSHTCTECHSKIAERYSGHSMASSAWQVAEAPIVEDYKGGTFQAPGRYRYDIEQDGEQVTHYQRKFNRDNEVISELAESVEYVVGSGQRGRSYFIRRGDLLFQSPVTWYSHKKRWDLSPGFESRTWHTGRRIVDGCVQCHFGPVQFDSERQEDTYPEQVFLEESIGCERCHGPGASHVKWHRSSVENQAGQDPIVDISKLSARKREAVCYQCHLQGVERITRYGRGHFDFRPGNELCDVWMILKLDENSVQDGDTEAVSQVMQMRSSQCFQQSEGRLGCTSCHNPHGTPNAESRVEFYRQSCLDCHESDASPCHKPEHERREFTAEDSCIACHMPALQTSDVPHTAQTDHRILRNSQSDIHETDATRVFTFFDDADERVPDGAAERAIGILMVQVAQREDDQLLALEACRRLEPLVASHSDDLQILHNLGTAYQLQSQNHRAADYWKKCLEQNPLHEPSLMSLAISFHHQGEWNQAIPYFERVLSFNEWNREVSGRYIHSLGRAGRLDDAFEFAKEAIQRFPDDWQIHAWLAEAYRVRGIYDQSKFHANLSQQFKESP